MGDDCAGGGYLAGLEIDVMQSSIMVLNLYGPGFGLVVIFVRNVHDGGNHVTVHLR